MAGQLAHSPADIIRYLLINEGLGSIPDADNDWPIFAHFEPTRPDNCITVYDTQEVRHGRAMPTGQTELHYGMQVRIRAALSPTSYAKASAITIAMETIYQQLVTIDSSVYEVHSVNHASGPVVIGREEDTSRMIATVNFLSCIEQEN